MSIFPLSRERVNTPVNDGSEETKTNNERFEEDIESVQPPEDGVMRILDAITSLESKVDSLDKSNKKFLMGASVKKIEALESNNEMLKNALMDLTDQIFMIGRAINLCKDDGLKDVLKSYWKNAVKTLKNVGIVPIIPSDGKFDERESECIAREHLPELPDDSIVKIHQLGYKDDSGVVLRYAKVTVNSLMESE